MNNSRWILMAGAVIGLGMAAPLRAADTKEALWAAARTGDVKALESLLAKGADVNAKNEIGISALWLATSKGHLEAAKVLLKHKADANVRDGIWYQTPLSQTASSKTAARSGPHRATKSPRGVRRPSGRRRRASSW